MRALKFRAWDKENEVYLSPDDTFIIAGNGYHPATFSSTFGYTANENLVIEQYTGLKDKNGKEIYEGDIIRVQNGEHTMLPTEKKADCSEVVFEWGAFKYLSDNGNENTMEYLYPYNLEVIGNIHENPELLKG